METRQLGSLWPVSALTLGGGGLGQVWGETDRDEAVATARAGVDAGINLLDLAPLYGRGEAEQVVGQAFDQAIPAHVRVTTKCYLGTIAGEDVYPRLKKTLVRSLETLGREQMDVFFLHTNIRPDDYTYLENSETQDQFSTRWTLYEQSVVPAFHKLISEGLIGAWGITGVGVPRSVMEALRADAAPGVVQAVSNVLDSAGNMRRYDEPAEPRNIIRTAVNNGVGVLGIRAVQAGALTREIDRPLPDTSPEMRDYKKAEPFRALCSAWGEDPALIAHQYALSMEGVDSVVLGVKNRAELSVGLEAERRGALSEDALSAIAKLRLNFQIPRMPID
ncbi:MAG: aldo/keto reductase [Parvibaculaceae bacterium]|nr:aldo/keto reductase [Parvibaculaceae bacterium]